MTKGLKGFQKGHQHSEETKRKIGDANRRPFYFYCDECNKECITKLSAFKKKKRHFCSMKCYKNYIKKLPFNEQNAYRGIRKNGETKQIYHRNYCKNHPENIAHLKSCRYARQRGAKGFHTLKEWQELKKKFNNCCAYCKKEKPLTKDHIIPLSRGGTNFINNIQPLCRNCNSKKWKYIYENPELMEKK